MNVAFGVAPVLGATRRNPVEVAPVTVTEISTAPTPSGMPQPPVAPPWPVMLLPAIWKLREPKALGAVAPAMRPAAWPLVSTTRHGWPSGV